MPRIIPYRCEYAGKWRTREGSYTPLRHHQHVIHKRYPMFDMLNMCVNEARIVTCIVNHTRTDRET
jgi:hypothetical protein